MKKNYFNMIAVAFLVTAFAFGWMPDAEAALAGLAVIGNTADIRLERGKLIKAARDLHEVAEGENRNFNAEEQASYDSLINKSSDLQERITRSEKQDELDRDSAEIIASGMGNDLDLNSTEPAAVAQKEMRAFAQMLAFGRGGVDEDLRANLDATSQAGGGALIPPKEFMNRLIQAVDDQTFIRALATVIPVSGSGSLGVPSLDTDPSDADWTSDILSGSDDTDMAFGTRELNPSPLAKRIKINETLMRRSAVPIENIVLQRLAYKFGITQEKAFLTGDGQNGPLGVFTASDDGIPTGRDFAFAGAAAVTGDDFIGMKYNLKGQYHAAAQWILHRDVQKLIALLKDSNGQYIWRTGLVAGDPDRLLNLPINMSEYAPNTVTTGQYTAMLGDFSHYWIAEEQTIRIKRLEELYSETNDIGFHARAELDGMPTLAEAFVRGKQA